VLLRIGHLTAVMVILTTYGIPVLLVVTVAQWWIGHDRQSVRHVCVAAFMAFVVSLSFNQFLLLSIHRVRSYDSGTTHLLIPPIADWSFPSDHATASFAIAATFLLHKLPQRGVLYLAAATLWAFSHIYVGTHYVGDVLGGAGVGVVAAVMVRMTYREGSKFDGFLTSIL
jgi:undecaprenyl-diphosphatase